MKYRLTAIFSAVVLVIGAVFGGAGANTASAQSASGGSGGNLRIVVVNNEYLNLDPAHDENDVTDSEIMNSIYGGLFYQTVKGGIGLGMASAYKFSDGNKKLTITIRPGIKFSDGSALTAQVVAWNINRDLLPANACDCLNSFEEVSSTKAVGNNVVITTKVPDAPLLQAFIENAPNWPASEVAVNKAIAASSSHSDEAFGQHPVGAGPFKLSQFVPNSKVVVTKNPLYYVKGEPKLDSLTFSTTPVDQSAYSALQSGSADMVLGVTTVPIIKQAESSEKVINQQSPVINDFEMNSNAPPFNNLKARQAVAYALNGQQMLNIVSPGYGSAEHGFIGPASPFYEKNVPGVIHYNLAKAKALVKQLGGLSLDIQTLTSASAAVAASALQNQLSAAGIKVKITTEQLTTEDNNLMSNHWQVVTGASGGADPDIGPQGLPTRFSSTGLYSCCKNPQLDQLINKTITTAGFGARKKVLDEIYALLAKNSYVVPLYAVPSAILYSPKVGGLKDTAAEGASLTAYIEWGEVTLSS